MFNSSLITHIKTRIRGRVQTRVKARVKTRGKALMNVDSRLTPSISRVSPRASTLLICLSIFSLLSGVADARPRPKKRKGVSEMLQKLSWGQGHQAVIKHLQTIIQANYKTLITEESSPIKADRLRAEMKQKADAVKSQYMSFTGQRTGYSVSFLKDDFAHNNGETLLKFEEEGRSRYYFFRYNQLWKIVISYPSEQGVPFKEFIDMVRKGYGRPKNMDWETPYGGSRQLVGATWEDDRTQLRVEDNTGFYGVYVMKLIARAQGAKITKIHAARKKPKREIGTPEKIDDSIDIFGEEEQVDSVVDQITGKKHDVDLERVDTVPMEEEGVNVRPED